MGSDKIQGHERYKDMTCAYCSRQILAELIEVRIGYAIYKCPSCGRETRKKSIGGFVIDAVALLNPFRINPFSRDSDS